MFIFSFLLLATAKSESRICLLRAFCFTWLVLFFVTFCSTMAISEHAFRSSIQYPWLKNPGLVQSELFSSPIHQLKNLDQFTLETCYYDDPNTTLNDCIKAALPKLRNNKEIIEILSKNNKAKRFQFLSEKTNDFAFSIFEFCGYPVFPFPSGSMEPMPVITSQFVSNTH